RPACGAGRFARSESDPFTNRLDSHRLVDTSDPIARVASRRRRTGNLCSAVFAFFAVHIFSVSLCLCGPFLLRMTSVQVVVVGGGHGGYAAAFLAADLGLSTALVDPEVNPGGVCVYRGCIPSKALLHVAKLIDESRQA